MLEEISNFDETDSVMSALNLEAYDIIKQKMGDKKARLLFEYIDNKVAENVEHDTKQLASKQALMTAREELIKKLAWFSQT